MIIEEVAQGIYQLQVAIPGDDGIFTTYLINEGGGVVIEPGPTTAIPSIQEAMKQLAMKELAYIIPTHIHIDHAGAIGSLSNLFSSAKVILHPVAVRHAVDPSRLIESTKMSFGNNFEASYGPITPVPDSQVMVPQDGETVSIDNRELQIIYAPGHATHHIVIFDSKTRGLFSGEALGTPRPGAESSPLPGAAPPSFDMKVYLETITKLKALAPSVLFYSHDGVGRKPQELIPKVVENTELVGNVILNALKEGQTDEAIYHRSQQYISSYLGADVTKSNIKILVDGFIFFFRKNNAV